MKKSSNRRKCFERSVGRPRRRCALCLVFPTNRARLNLHLHLEKMGKTISASAGRANSVTNVKRKLHSTKIWRDEKQGSCIPAVALDSQKAIEEKQISSDMKRITNALRDRSKKTCSTSSHHFTSLHPRHVLRLEKCRCRGSRWIPETNGRLLDPRSK